MVTLPKITLPLPEEQSLSRLPEGIPSGVGETLYDLFSSAEAKFAQGNFEGALALCQQIYDAARSLEDRDLLARASHNLAAALWKLDRRSENREFYRRAIQANPGLAEAWAALGLASLALEDYAEAELAVDRALKFMPENTELRFLRGIILSRQGRLQEAVAALERTLKLNPDYVRGWLYLAFVLIDETQWDNALASFERAFALRKQASRELQEALYYSFASTLLARGVEVMSQGDLDRAQELMAQLRRLQIQGRIERQARAVRKAMRNFGTSYPEHRESFKALMAMLKEPWVNWIACSHIVSEYWPKGLSAVEAVRQARKWPRG